MEKTNLMKLDRPTQAATRVGDLIIAALSVAVIVPNAVLPFVAAALVA
jgi:hypothetical protein